MEPIVDYLNGAKILIVDDIPENLKVLGNNLKILGIQIEMAINGKQAIALAKAKNPDLILLDIQMPIMDGFAVCIELKQDPETSEIPVIFLTARTEAEDILHGFAIGAVDYITKPFSTPELLARVSTHLRLKRTEQKYKVLNATKDKFLSIIAHDLKNPFNSILGLSSLLPRFLTANQLDKAKNAAEIINNSSKNLYKLLENLLSWARSQTGNIPYNPQPTNLHKICTNVLDFYSVGISNKKLNVNILIDEEISVYADENMLQTIIRNLVGNSIKFSNMFQVITIGCNKNEENILTIFVKDNGVGIPDEILANLFQIGQKQQGVGTAGEIGTGLGLILCKEFVEKHRGKIWVESAPNEGATFYFTIPCSN